MAGEGLAIVLALFSLSSHVCGYTIQDVNTLKERLMDKYNKNTAPASNDEWINITAAFMIDKIADLDERLEKLTTRMSLFTLWWDESLVWDWSETGIEKIFMSREDVWVPEFYVSNKHHSISYGVEETRNTPIEYSSSGHASYTQKITTETTCDLDTSKFPFDQHTCSIVFGVNKRQVNVVASFREMVLAMFQPDGSWDVVNSTLNEHYGYVTIGLTLVRKPTFILINLILPMLVLSFLSPLVFLLPNRSGERVGFSITVLLATSVFMTIVADSVPQKSHPFPHLLTMFFTSYSLTAAAVMIVIINAKVYRLPDHVQIPRPFVLLLRCTRPFCRCFRRRNVKDVADAEKENEENEALNETRSLKTNLNKRNPVTWKDIGWAIDMSSLSLLYALKVALLVVFMVLLKV